MGITLRLGPLELCWAPAEAAPCQAKRGTMSSDGA